MNKNIQKLISRVKMLSDTRVLGLLAFGFVALLVTWSGVKVVQLNYELDKKISVERQRNDVQKLRNENLRLTNTYYQTNQYLELSARRQFGKAAVGEKLYIVPEDAALARTSYPVKTKEKLGEKSQQESKLSKNLNDWKLFLLR